MENLDEENFGGYDAYFINELLDDHECPVCQMALREPIQTQCGHRLCLSCAEEMRKRNKGVLICPLDNSVLNPSKIFPDKAIERAVMQLKVKCSNVINGCEWTGELKILNKHLGSCEYQTLKCLNKPCSSSLLRKKLNEHMEKHCIYRLVTCHHCKQKIIFSEMQIHEENCECLPLCCVNQCGMKIMRNEGMRKEHATHASSSMQNHLSMAISKLEALENKMTLTVDTLENKIASKLNALENKITSKMESLETKIASESTALENKITSKMKSYENKNASEAVALENKITSTVDALKNELISKVDEQKDKIMLHEKNLEIIKAVLAVEMRTFARRFANIVPYYHFLRSTIYFQTEEDFKELRTFTNDVENTTICDFRPGHAYAVLPRPSPDRPYYCSEFRLRHFKAWCEQAKKNYK
ncbi:TNF receptor-associated factor 5 isoform X2 [Hydra vulgaris]|uniref:TNF receptor-associated factor 5 isoform X2 n=1 Tax=Hydra vulgaris TaxID=6087 RepID=UPI001F5EF798|nr:TNF receptor-associated factor 5-like isoform X2 [Hydra vulgaris]